MKTLQIAAALMMTVVILGSCSEKQRPKSVASGLLHDVVGAIGCKVVDSGSTFPLETSDRAFYQPLSFEIANIHTNEPLDGYHGATVGKYILAIETYSTDEEAKKRADDYRDLGRLASISENDVHELSKMTVRCWGYSSGRRVYLLTTLAAMYSALEKRTNFVITGIKAYEQE